MSNNKTIKPANLKTTSDIGMPIKLDGTNDKRYSDPQILNNDGTRDKRCNLLSERRKNIK